MPLPELIEAPQNIQFICIGQCVRGGKAHEKIYTPAASDGTIRRAADLPIGENLIATVRCRSAPVIGDYKKPHPLPRRRAFYTRMKKNNSHISRERDATDYALAAMEQRELYCQAHPGSPAAVRRPRLFIRGELWIALLDPSVEEGIVGIGSTVTAALRAFDAQYLAGLRPRIEVIGVHQPAQNASFAAV